MFDNVTETVVAWAKSFNSVTATCGALAAAAGWGVYDILITHPLRTFYLKGPWWHNIPECDICARMQGNKPEFPSYLYNSSEPMRIQCSAMIDREFESWNATIMTVLHFTVLTFCALQLTCHCCIVRPLVKAMGLSKAT